MWTRRSAVRRSSRCGNGPSPPLSGRLARSFQSSPFLPSPYRFVLVPLVDYILAVERDHPECQIAVLIPELVVRHWWQTPLHNQRAQLLKLLLLVRGNQRIIVINIPWYL